MVQTTLYRDRIPIVLDLDDYIQGKQAGAHDSLVNRTEHHQIDLWTVLPDQSVPVHIHPGSECILIVLAGRADFRLAGMPFEVKKGMLAIVPSGTDHEIANNGPDPLAILAIIGPGPFKTETKTGKS
ncbi:MAG TPA: cupin domain-containing protein [Methanocella sp.]|nr:cupin domain-containing protein [Methanocella sp.]